MNQINKQSFLKFLNHSAENIYNTKVDFALFLVFRIYCKSSRQPEWESQFCCECPPLGPKTIVVFFVFVLGGSNTLLSLGRRHPVADCFYRTFLERFRGWSEDLGRNGPPVYLALLPPKMLKKKKNIGSLTLFSSQNGCFC